MADPPAVGPSDPWAAGLFAGPSAAVLAGPAPPGVEFVAGRVAVDDTWTYERAAGRRAVFPWRAAGLPGGAVQVDVVFGEDPADPPARLSVPVADGGCVAVRAAGPAQSLAWKLLWLASDIHPQGKDLYDAVLLAERFPPDPAVIAETFRRAGEAWPGGTAAAFAGRLGADWNNFRAEYPWVGGDRAGWTARLGAALAPAFAAGPDEPPPEPPGDPARAGGFDPGWFTSVAVAVARGIDADAAFDRLPVLADALQDAGCEDGAVLGHCRGGGLHARGCWVVDRLLGRA